MNNTSAATTRKRRSIQHLARSVRESTIVETPAFKDLPTFTVTVSANTEEIASSSPWKISGVTEIVLPFGSLEVGTGTVYGMQFILDAPLEVTSAVFATPAITFGTPDTPAFNIAPFGTNQATIIWANTVPVDAAKTFTYTIHAIIDGHHVSHDPTVENLPPSIP